MNNLIQNQKGMAGILLTLLILMAMFFVALASSDIISNGLQMSKAHIHSTKAYYGAESGTERILWEIRKNGTDPVADSWGDGECVQYDGYPTGDIDTPSTDTCPPYTNADRQQLGNNVVYFTEYDFSDTITVKLKSVGDYQGMTRRAVQIGYVD